MCQTSCAYTQLMMNETFGEDVQNETNNHLMIVGEEAHDCSYKKVMLHLGIKRGVL